MVVAVYSSVDLLCGRAAERTLFRVDRAKLEDPLRQIIKISGARALDGPVTRVDAGLSAQTVVRGPRKVQSRKE